MPVQVQTTKQVSPLRRAFGLFGGLRLKLDETVVPVAIVEDLVADEWREAFVGDARGPPGAANRNLWSIENPDNSGKLLEVTEIGLAAGGTSYFRAVVTSTPYIPGTIVGGQWQDLDGVYRVPNSFPSGQLRWAAAAALPAGGVVWEDYVTASVKALWRPRVILHPGQEIVWFQTTLNINASVYVQWRERPLQSTER